MSICQQCKPFQQCKPCQQRKPCRQCTPCQQCQQCKQCQLFIARCYFQLWWYFFQDSLILHPLNFRGDQSSYNNGFPFESVEIGNQRAGGSGGWVSNCIIWLFLSSVKMTMTEKINHLKLRIFRQDQCPGGSIEACVGVCPGSSTRWPSMFFTSTNKKMDFSLINDSSSSSSECMGLVYEVATQDVRSNLLFLSFVFCRHSREKYTMKLSDVFNKAFVYTYQSQSWWRSLHF